MGTVESNVLERKSLCLSAVFGLLTIFKGAAQAAPALPLHSLRLVRSHQGRTELVFMPRSVVSDLPWNEGVTQHAAHQGQMLTKDPATGKVSDAPLRCTRS
jgi:hypothetical protein